MPASSSLILRQHLAPLLKQEREKRGLTPCQVAVECDLAAETIMRIENGSAISIKKYARLMHYYGKKMKIELVDRK